MKAKAKSTECTTLFDIDVSREDVAKAFEEVYDEIAKAANIPGFRVGKAPLDIVRRHYRENAREEVLKRLIPKAYRKALEEHKVNPVSLPEISDVSFQENAALSFKARVDTRPEFKLKEYKGIKIEKKKIVVKDEDSEKTLESLREINAKYINQDERPVQLGDYVMSDLECTVDSKPVHKKRENIWLSIDKESLIPGLNEKMTGMKKGEEKDIDIVLPEKYPDKGVAGKKAMYHVKVKEIKVRELPALDDEFAKALGKTSLEELRTEVRAELERRMKLNIEIDMENQLLKNLIDDNTFAVPSGLVKKQIEYMVEDAKRRLEEKGFKREELDKKDAEFAEKFKDDAARQVRLMFMLDDIAKEEGIGVDDKDIEDAYKAISVQAGQTIDKVKGYYEKEDLVDSLREKIKEEKVVRFLLEKAEIVEN